MFLIFYIILFTIFSTTIMSYIAIATPIGPWMAPVLAIIALIGNKIIKKSKKETLVLLVTSSSLGGILATAIGFSFPTLYFLNKEFFNQLLNQPFLFITIIFGISLSAGLIGIYVAHSQANNLIEKQRLSFPIGTLVYKILTAEEDLKKITELSIGFLTTFIYSLLFVWKKTALFLPHTIMIMNSFVFGPFSFPGLQLTMTQLPMLLSIGYIAGSVITIPLLIGTLSKICIIDIMHTYFFNYIEMTDFLFAFCSGMVVSGSIISIIFLPKSIFLFFKNRKKNNDYHITDFFNIQKIKYFLPVFTLTSCILCKQNFSFLSQWYLIFFSLLCAYQIAVIAGKIGLALLGRFATFVMIPGMLIFKLTDIQITIIATFVEICGGIATDALFGIKTSRYFNMPQKSILKYHLLGLCIASITVGIVVWFLVTHFTLGSDLLFAERSQGRALLIQATHFNHYVLLCGAFFGICLRFIKINPLLVLGGLLMPLSLTFGLVLGGICSYIVNKKYDIEALCSGIFAANSLGIIIQAFYK